MVTAIAATATATIGCCDDDGDCNNWGHAATMMVATGNGDDGNQALIKNKLSIFRVMPF